MIRVVNFAPLIVKHGPRILPTGRCVPLPVCECVQCRMHAEDSEAE